MRDLFYARRLDVQALQGPMESAAKVPQGGVRALRRGERESPSFPHISLSRPDHMTLATGLPHCQDAAPEPRGPRCREPEEVRFPHGCCLLPRIR